MKHENETALPAPLGQVERGVGRLVSEGTQASVERPILFSAPMVRAILAGTKTQTRRIWKMPRGCSWYDGHGGEAAGMVQDDEGPAWWHVSEQRCPYGKPGDRLWVREAWRTEPALDPCPPREIAMVGAPVQYEAGPHAEVLGGKLRPGMFMPRGLARITLVVTSVRVERLQDISRGDAMAEGCPFPNMANATSPRDWYAALWEQINGGGSWDANPWVWVVEFRKTPNPADWAACMRAKLDALRAYDEAEIMPDSMTPNAEVTRPTRR